MTFTTLLFIITLGALAIIGIAIVWLIESHHRHEDKLADAYVEIICLKEHVRHLKEKIGGGNQQPTKRHRKGVRK